MQISFLLTMYVFSILSKGYIKNTDLDSVAIKVCSVII